MAMVLIKLFHGQNSSIPSRLFNLACADKNRSSRDKRKKKKNINKITSISDQPDLTPNRKNYSEEGNKS
jgi:hypothetical protein